MGNKTLIAYKGFDKDMKCRGFQYEVGKEYETDKAKACISGGTAGVELARDIRYKENFEAKGVDLSREIEKEIKTRWYGEYLCTEKFEESAKHFFELGLKVQKGE